MITSHAAGISANEFWEHLAAAAIIPVTELARLRAEHAGIADGGVLSQALVSAGKLTAFQAAAVLEQRVNELRIGNYDVLEQLGKGGMGTVFKARHRTMKRIVALKVLAREIAVEATFVQRFQREVETIAQLGHPNIVMAFDAAEDAVGHYLVMEFVDGRDLASEVAKSGPLSVAEAVSCTLQAARGLEYAHGRGIIHRDIKPANLLRDVHGTVKVADLGLARLANSTGGSGVHASLTQAGGVVGTVDFMSPEQAMDSTAIDHRADIYSLGCTLYFLLTGRAPYLGTSMMSILLAHRDSPVPSLSARRADVPAALDVFLEQAAAKKPKDRFATMTAMVQALETLVPATAHLTTRPIPALPSPSAGSTEQTVVVSRSTPSDDTDARAQSTATPPVADAGPVSGLLRAVVDITVVLAEPSRTQAGIVRKYLQDVGISKVHTTGSGHEAIELAKKVQGQVLLSAMHLSDVTGLQLVDMLRADAACANVGFILASSTSDSLPAETFVHDPRFVLMPKPFDSKALAFALARATGRLPEDFTPAADKTRA